MRSTVQSAPPSGVLGRLGASLPFLDGDGGRLGIGVPFDPLASADVAVTCKAFVPLNKTQFLWMPPSSIDSFIFWSCSSMDSLSRGVDSPESIASLTITVP